MSRRYTLGFIGAGNMAEAILRAALAKGVLEPERVAAFDPSPDRRRILAELGVAILEDNDSVATQSEQLLLAIKPQALAQVAPTLTGLIQPSQVIISILAGVSTARLARAIAGDSDDAQSLRVIRVMPNTPMMVGQGMSAIALGPGAQAGDEALAMRLFSAGGRVIRVDESLMDAVTAVSGSGPAYVFYLAEAMERAAGELGLAEHARLLVSQTLLGAAMLLNESGQPPAELRRRVTSPGGTTEAAIKHLDASRAQQIIVEAIHAACRRSLELGGQD